MRLSILFLFMACSIFSCGKRVLVSKMPAALITSNIDTLAKKEVKVIDSSAKKTIEPQKIDDAELKLVTEDLNFNYLKAKSKIVWKTQQNQDTYTVDIRMKKDSLIWVNISQTGITGATGLFSKSNVQFYQKINGEYFNLTYDSVSVIMGFKVDYLILQSLIVGNQPYKKNNSRVIRENENIILKQQEGRINIDNMVGPNRKLKKLLVNDVPTSNKMTMDFEEFTLLNQVLFPFSSQINLDVKDKDNKSVNTLISIKYSKVELLDTPLEFPFKVPEKLLNPTRK
ncbi:MAG: DUF4292 domain-containing protein [Cytophagia bacterium]|nr:DUF4292 domain-containing protein [Cytophagia bacterium]